MEINLKTKTIPLNTFILTSKIKDIDLINNLINTIKEKSKNNELNFKTHVKGLFSGFDSFVKDINFYKFIKSINYSIYDLNLKKITKNIVIPINSSIDILLMKNNSI